MEKTICLLIGILLPLFSAFANESPAKQSVIEVKEAGTLLDSIGIDAIESVVNLTVSGPLNGTDILTIRKMKNLSGLSLSKAKIENGGLAYFQNHTTQNNVIGKDFFNGMAKLATVILPESSTSIETGAFSDNPELKKVTISDATISIMSRAFNNCNKLESIVIPASVKTMDPYAFAACSLLKEIYFADSDASLQIPTYGGQTSFPGCPLETIYIGRNIYQDSEYSLLGNESSVKEVTFGKKVRYISPFLFYNNTQLLTVNMQADSLESIGKKAFSECSGLTSFYLPSSLIAIGDEAFQGCTSLASLKLPEKLKIIGTNAFKRCHALESVVIPASVSKLSSFAFYDCKRLSSVTINATIDTIEEQVFYNCNSLKKLTLPKHLKTIQTHAFAHCNNLSALALPDGLEFIGRYAFYHCRNITELDIPDGIKTIASGTFEGLEKLVKIKLPENLSRIGDDAFKDCKSLLSVTIPASVTAIGSSTFFGCSKLAEINCKADTPPSAFSYSFDEINKTECTLYVPKGTYQTYWLSQGWGDFQKIKEKDFSVSNEAAVTPETKIYGIANGIAIETDKPLKISVYSVTGRLVQQTPINTGTTHLSAHKGIYIVSTPVKAHKVVVR